MASLTVRPDWLRPHHQVLCATEMVMLMSFPSTDQQTVAPAAPRPTSARDQPLLQATSHKDVDFLRLALTCLSACVGYSPLPIPLTGAGGLGRVRARTR